MDLTKNLVNGITAIASESTKYYADSVEWCPLNPFQNFFACGTYQLENDCSRSAEHADIRKGDITLYQISRNSPTTTKKSSLETKANVETSGVLDIKWAPHYINEKCTFGVAFSNGYVQLKQIIIKEADSTELINLCEVNIAPEGRSLALALDWASWKHEVIPENNIVSDSSGNLNLINLSNTGLYLQKKWKAHDFEVWIAAFDYDNINIIYSGADDCILKSWDLRTDLTSPLFLNKSHTMGVTSAVKSRNNEHLLVTGSYDEYVRVWDTRKMKSSMYDVHVNGGVWRIKWHPYFPNYLVVAAMHAGFHVLHLNCTSGSNITASFSDHMSLAYGVDWCWCQHNCPISTIEEDQIESSDQFNQVKDKDQKITESTVASCSFYDRSVRLWTIDLPCLT